MKNELQYYYMLYEYLCIVKTYANLKITFKILKSIFRLTSTLITRIQLLHYIKGLKNRIRYTELNCSRNSPASIVSTNHRFRMKWRHLPENPTQIRNKWTSEPAVAAFTRWNQMQNWMKEFRILNNKNTMKHVYS